MSDEPKPLTRADMESRARFANWHVPLKDWTRIEATVSALEAAEARAAMLEQALREMGVLINHAMSVASRAKSHEHLTRAYEIRNAALSAEEEGEAMKTKKVEAWAAMVKDSTVGAGTLSFSKVNVEAWARDAVPGSVEIVHLVPADPAKEAVYRAALKKKHRQDSFCISCGPSVGVDEDGCCASCGASALGEWADRAAAVFRAVERATKGRKR